MRKSVSGAEALTREELGQYRKISKEIQLLREQLAEQEKELNQIKAYGVVRGSSPTFPYVLHDIPVQGGESGNRALRAEYRLTIRHIKQRLRERQRELRRLDNYIASIEDAELRQIFMLRYVFTNCSWLQIARKMGENYTAEGIRARHNRYLGIK